MNIPDEINDDRKEILGMPNFRAGPIAHLMVKSGEVAVPPKAEEEQAAVIHKLLGFYAVHGAGWRKAAGEWLGTMQDRVKAKAA